jgi:hypothetical protein
MSVQVRVSTNTKYLNAAFSEDHYYCRGVTRGGVNAGVGGIS